MKFRVVFSPSARSDLQEIRTYIRGESSAAIASRFVRDLREFITELAVFPGRATLRNDFFPGLRVIGFRRRVSIHFIVLEQSVLVVALAYAGRNWTADYPPGER